MIWGGLNCQFRLTGTSVSIFPRRCSSQGMARSPNSVVALFAMLGAILALSPSGCTVLLAEAQAGLFSFSHSLFLTLSHTHCLSVSPLPWHVCPCREPLWREFVDQEYPRAALVSLSVQFPYSEDAFNQTLQV